MTGESVTARLQNTKAWKPQVKLQPISAIKLSGDLQRLPAIKAEDPTQTGKSLETFTSECHSQPYFPKDLLPSTDKLFTESHPYPEETKEQLKAFDTFDLQYRSMTSSSSEVDSGTEEERFSGEQSQGQ
jgi:hypothetical protein